MSPPLSVTFKMSTDEGQNGKQCNCKYLDPTVVLEKDKELELPVMNPLTNSIIAVFLWHIIKQINKNKLTQTNKPSKLINSSQTLSFEGRKSEWNTTTSFHHVQVERKRENRHKGEKNTISVPQYNTTVRQSVKMRPISAYTLTSSQTLALLKIWKRGHKI